MVSGIITFQVNNNLLWFWHTATLLTKQLLRIWFSLCFFFLIFSVPVYEINRSWRADRNFISGWLLCDIMEGAMSLDGKYTIHTQVQIHFAILTNTLVNWDKYIVNIWQIHKDDRCNVPWRQMHNPQTSTNTFVNLEEYIFQFVQIQYCVIYWLVQCPLTANAQSTNKYKYICQFGGIHLSICTNTVLCDIMVGAMSRDDKCTIQTQVQIHLAILRNKFVYLNKYICQLEI